MKHFVLVTTLSISLPLFMNAQFDLHRDNSVPMHEQGDPLDHAWAGGLNFVQVSDIDLDLDGNMDLFLFDRSGNKVVTFLNNGTPGVVDYTYDHSYEKVWPFTELHDWALMRDYNCDGKNDIFTYSVGGIAVYKNISTTSLQFELVEDLIYSDFISTQANLFVSAIDIPSIDDIDGDGDLDVVTFSLFGSTLEYHKNLSLEMGYGCDSLIFELRNRCWGYFVENANNNSVTLNQPCPNNVSNPEDEAGDMTEKDGVHVGSTVTTLDLDGDGDKDVLLGDVSFNNITALYNGGTPDSAIMVSQDTAFPSYDVPIDLPIFPGTFYVDLNNDDKRDLVVSPNGRNQAQNFESMWFYRNNGTDAAPYFNFQQTNVLQDEILEVGEGACPIPFDHNGDGLVDLLVNDLGYFQAGGNYPGKLALLENIGTASTPSFSLADRDYMGLSTSGIGQAMHPSFGDLDGDGDQDMLIGDLQGKLHYFENISSSSFAQFQLNEPNYQDAAGSPIDVGQFATPQLFDVDGDGLLDLLIGERNGNINYYKNTGSASAPAFELINDSIGGVVVAEYWNITGYSVPFMFLNHLGERELVVGSEVGYIHHYDNIDGNLNGLFNLVDSTLADIRTGIRSGVALADLNSSGQLDMLVGNYRGGLAFFRNDFTVEVQEVEETTPFLLVPNPASDRLRLVLQRHWSPDLRLTVTDALGKIIMDRSVSSSSLELDVSMMPAGVYHFTLATEGQRWSQRAVLVE